MNTGSNAAALQLMISALLAILLDWLPGLRTWWHPLEENQKKVYMSVLLFLSLIGLAFSECYLNGVCPEVWTDYILELAGVYLAGLAVNQGAHAVTKPSQAQVEARTK